jgi:hypothetical protein
VESAFTGRVTKRKTPSAATRVFEPMSEFRPPARLTAPVNRSPMDITISPNKSSQYRERPSIHNGSGKSPIMHTLCWELSHDRPSGEPTLTSWKRRALSASGSNAGSVVVHRPTPIRARALWSSKLGFGAKLKDSIVPPKRRRNPATK